MDKKRTFHRAKKDDNDEEPKKAAHPKVEEVEEEDEESMSAGAKKIDEDPLDNEDVQEETTAPAGEEEVDTEPAQAGQPSPQKSEGDQGSFDANGPKINFDYPQSQGQNSFSQVQRSVGGQNLDDLAQEGQEEYDQSTYAQASVDRPNQPSQPGPAPRPVNPYAQPGQQNSPEFGMRSIRQPQPGPTFPGGQNMNPNGNGNGNVRPQGQFAPSGGNFNFRRDGNYRSGSNSKVYFIVLLAIGLVVLGGAVYLLKNQLRPAAPSPTPAPEVVITTPEPSPTPEAIDRSQFTVRVLNGSGKTGLAKEVSDKLKELGYKIERTGNATNSAFAQTLIRTQDDQKLSDQLVLDLKGLGYDPASGSALRSNDASDAEVILGAK